MLNSKNKLILILLSVHMLSLVACNLPTPQDKKSDAGSVSEFSNTESATFNVEPIPSRSSVLEAGKDETFALPTSKVFNIYACLKDAYYNKPISGHIFHIEEAHKDAMSDSSGCIGWSETIKYNFLADSKYIRWDRHIRGTGLHKGIRTVSYAINPWSHGESLAPVMDLKNEDAIPNLVKLESESNVALQGLSADNKPRNRSLWLDDGRLFVTEQKMNAKGVDLLLELRGVPSIQLSKINGEIWLRPLTQGTFKVRLKLIHNYTEGENQIHRLLKQSELIDASMENGSLAVRAPMTLTQIPTRGQLILGLELQPVNAPEGLTGFNGIYILGDYDQIKGTSFLKLATEVAQEKNFQISNYINAQDDSIKPTSEVYQKPKIEVSQLDFKFVRVGEEKTATKQAIYNIKACLKNGLDQKSTRSQTFKVTKFRQNESDKASELTIQTDNNSCINWEETVEYKYFACEHYIKGMIQIESPDLGMNQKIDIVVNPWDVFNTGRDMRYIDPTEKLITDCSKSNRPKTQIMIDSFYYNTISYKYQVDELLNLNVIKKVQMKIDPKILIYSSLSNGRSEVQKLRDGIYLLKVAIVRNRDYDNNKNTYVTSTSKLVNVLNGQINTDLTFKTQDLKALGNRNNILVEIDPVDESKVQSDGTFLGLKNPNATLESVVDEHAELESPTFVGPIVLNLDEANRALRMLDDSSISAFLANNKGTLETGTKGLIANITAQGLAANEVRHQQQASHATSKQYADDHNLALINVKDMTPATLISQALKIKSEVPIQLGKGDLQSLLATRYISKDFALNLCNFWTREFFANQYTEKGGALSRRHASNFYSDCYKAASNDPTKFFQVDNRLIVKEVGDTQYLKGFNQGISVGTSFSMSFSDSANFNVTRTVSLSTKLGLGKIFFDMFSLDAGMNFSTSWANSESKSTSSSISVNATTALLAQTSTLKIRINKYEQCTQVKLNPLLFVKDDRWFGRKDYLEALNPRLSDSEKIQAITRGLLVCEGQTRSQPFDIQENYYLITQESMSAQMQDNGDDRNRNFFVALRSTNDFNRFVGSIKGEIKMPGSSDKEVLHKDVNNFLETIFTMKDPAQPGLYLINK